MTQHNILKAKLEDIANITGCKYFSISKPIVNIGRSLKNDLVIKKDSVSARHAAIEQKPDGHFIIDLNSTNKTHLNGTVLDPNSPHRLNDGDKIVIDTFSFIFKLEQNEPPQPASTDEENFFFDSSALMDALTEAKPSAPVPDEETVCLMDALKEIEPSAPVPDEETVCLMDALTEAKPSAPVPDDEPISLMDELREAEPSAPVPDDEP
ncbi:MAG: FHA domain-containing protein, partial [Proteobacteria bacterium]|nr:FHA domain-containing protein [Pseudomonadota bacterium]